jgi:hypothetical protein
MFKKSGALPSLIVTRAITSPSAWQADLLERGVQMWHYPLFDLVPLAHANEAELAAEMAWAQLIVFVSPSAAQSAAAALKRTLAAEDKLLAVPGPGTASALARAIGWGLYQTETEVNLVQRASRVRVLGFAADQTVFDGSHCCAKSMTAARKACISSACCFCAAR